MSGAVEGIADEAALRCLCQSMDFDVGFLKTCGGKTKLDQKLSGYNAAARLGPWIVLRDLDHDAVCPAQLVRGLLPGRSERMQLRIVHRSIEAWLMADRGGFARFMSISEARVPRSPEELDDPKRVVVDLARRSRRRAIRDDMVPREGSGAKEGPAYASRLIEFINQDWRPHVAAESSDSLARCLGRLQEWLDP